MLEIFSISIMLALKTGCFSMNLSKFDHYRSILRSNPGQSSCMLFVCNTNTPLSSSINFANSEDERNSADEKYNSCCKVNWPVCEPHNTILTYFKEYSLYLMMISCDIITCIGYRAFIISFYITFLSIVNWVVKIRRWYCIFLLCFCEMPIWWLL